MLVLITYDVATDTSEGRRRLRQVAKACVAKGQRVQNSVFECSLDASQLKILQNELESIIDPQQDSLRFYNLGNNYSKRIVHVGAKETYKPDDVMII